MPKFPDTIDFTLKGAGFDTVRAELNYGLVGDPVTSGVRADVPASSPVLDLKVTVDLSVDYIPPGTEVTYYWTLTGLEGNTVDTPSKSFKLLDENYNWQSLSDVQGHLSVHWYQGSQAFGKRLLDTATGALDRLQGEIQAGLQRPADIWIYATQDELLSGLPKNSPEWVGGRAFPELALVLAAIADDETADSETKRVIPHELSHLVLYQATRNPYNSPPAWFDEGLAVHNQQAHDPFETEALKQAAQEGNLLPLKALSGSFGADTDIADLSYAESRSVMDFVTADARFGPEKLARTVAAFKGGVTYDEALKAGLGVTVEELDAQWRASLPYKAAQQETAPRPSTGNQPQGPQGPQGTTAPDSSWTTPLALATLGIFAGLLMTGGLITLIALIVHKRQGPGV